MITTPFEQDLLNGLAFLDQIRSQSLPGLSRIQLIFEPGTDLFRARQVVAERLAEAQIALPGVSRPPQMLQPLSSTNRVMILGLVFAEVSAIEMSVLARWTITPRLLAVPGVANVAVWGFRDRQLQVHVDPRQLRAGGVSLQQVIETSANALWVSPLSFVEASVPGTGGFIDTPNQRLGVMHIFAHHHGGRPRPGEGRGNDVSPRRRGDGRRGSSAADRGCTRPASDRPRARGREVPGRQHARSDPGHRGRDRRDAARSVRNRVQHDDLPAGVLHRGVDRQRRPGLDHRLRPRPPGSGGLLLRLARSPDRRLSRSRCRSWRLGSCCPRCGETVNAMVVAGFVAALGLVIHDVVRDVGNFVRRLRQPPAKTATIRLRAVLLEASLELRGAPGVRDADRRAGSASALRARRDRPGIPPARSPSRICSLRSRPWWSR